jgi:hypothetical protein
MSSKAIRKVFLSLTVGGGGGVIGGAVYILPIIAGILVLSYLICTVVPPPHKHNIQFMYFQGFAQSLLYMQTMLYLFLNRYVHMCKNAYGHSTAMGHLPILQA